MTHDPAAPPRHANRLARETSPYLLQHAHNPVDWHAWGPEAFELARSLDKPIFLSVGYSTCYWCHVMERQSFEVEAVAAVMNELFVNIKVDREERPDVDQLYMNAVQVLEGHGGWPMSVFLTPDLRPFHGGTYYPPTDSYGRPGFVTVLRAVHDAYRNRKADVEKAATQLTSILAQLAEPQPPGSGLTIDDDFLARIIDRSTGDYDSLHGGFGSAPKFPRETLLDLLLASLRNPRSQIADRDSQFQQMLERTLDAMADGGIRDQLGGGFHRYSTDAHWLVPHFEIMLYDQAMLARAYADAADLLGQPRLAAVARGTLDFVLREMTGPASQFYTAFDAEVDAREGLSYLWTIDEVRQVLGNEDAKLFARAYGLDRGPNFADPHHGSGVPDASILHLPEPLPQLAALLGLTEAALEARLAPMRQKLYAVRRQRKQPLLDTKVLTSWNALMIRAFAEAARFLKEPAYADAAGRAAHFLLTEHRRPDGTLYRTSRGDVKKFDAFLDDYAFLAQALLDLHETTGNPRWKDEAAALAATMKRLFGDEEKGGFYFTAASAQDLVVRQKVAQDSPLPGGNAVAARVLLKLGQAEEARRTVATFARPLTQHGPALSSLVEAALECVAAGGPIVVGAGTAPAAHPPSPEEAAEHAVTVEGEWAGPSELRLHLTINEPFHIQGQDAPEGLIATRVNVGGDAAADVQAIDYPPAARRHMPFAPDPVPLYEGQVTVSIRFRGPMSGRMPVPLALTYQACDETACLPPVTTHFDAVAP